MNNLALIIMLIEYYNDEVELHSVTLPPILLRTWSDLERPNGEVHVLFSSIFTEYGRQLNGN